MSRNAYIQFNHLSPNAKLEVTNYDYYELEDGFITFFSVEEEEVDYSIAMVNLNSIDCIQFEEAEDE